MYRNNIKLQKRNKNKTETGLGQECTRWTRSLSSWRFKSYRVTPRLLVGQTERGLGKEPGGNRAAWQVLVITPQYTVHALFLLSSKPPCGCRPCLEAPSQPGSVLGLGSGQWVRRQGTCALFKSLRASSVCFLSSPRTPESQSQPSSQAGMPDGRASAQRPWPARCLELPGRLLSGLVAEGKSASTLTVVSLSLCSRLLLRSGVHDCFCTDFSYDFDHCEQILIMMRLCILLLASCVLGETLSVLYL